MGDGASDEDVADDEDDEDVSLVMMRLVMMLLMMMLHRCIPFVLSSPAFVHPPGTQVCPARWYCFRGT